MGIFHIFISFITDQSFWRKSSRKKPQTSAITFKIDNKWKHADLPSLYKVLLKIHPRTSQSRPMFGNHCIYRYYREFFKLTIYQCRKKEIYQVKCQHKRMSWSFHYTFSWAIHRKQAHHLFYVYKNGKGAFDRKCYQKMASTGRRLVHLGSAWGWHCKLTWIFKYRDSKKSLNCWGSGQ